MILIISLIIIVKSKDVEKYSIVPFINYLKENEYWEVLEDVNNNFGPNVSIELCKLTVSSPHCEEVVRVYFALPHSLCKKGENDIKLINYLNKNNYMEILLKNKSIWKKLSIINKLYKLS